VAQQGSGFAWATDVPSLRPGYPLIDICQTSPGSPKSLGVLRTPIRGPISDGVFRLAAPKKRPQRALRPVTAGGLLEENRWARLWQIRDELL
jgi:hypothetical protein